MGHLTIALFRRYAAALERGFPAEGERLPGLPRNAMVGADTWAAVHVELARLEGSGVDVRRAHDLLAEVERRGGCVIGGLGLLVSRVRGVAADLLGQEDDALVALQRAMTTAQTLGAEPEHARALVDVAVILLRRGERRDAFANLDDARARFERLGMSPDVERAEYLGSDGFARATGTQQSIARQAPEAATTANAVILFSDVVDSTRQTEELGTARYRERARGVEELVTATIAAHGGTIVSGINLGDGFIGLFPSIDRAVVAARQCARGTSATGLHLHLALHSGEIVVDGHRIYGSPVNYAARLCDMTGPDEILVSDTIRERASGLPDVAFLDRGEHAFKGFAEPQRAYALVEPQIFETLDP
jgi:class 3 adenylate cyclase